MDSVFIPHDVYTYNTSGRRGRLSLHTAAGGNEFYSKGEGNHIAVLFTEIAYK